jgi:hypothetical protein
MTIIIVVLLDVLITTFGLQHHRTRRVQAG